MMEWTKEANGEDVGEAPSFLLKTCIPAFTYTHVEAHNLERWGEAIWGFCRVSGFVDSNVQLYYWRRAQRRSLRWLVGALATPKRHVLKWWATRGFNFITR
jgi:hypothetical protein